MFFNQVKFRSCAKLVLLLGGLIICAEATGCDTDGDGVPDSVDNCVLLANTAQGDGDGDGIGDACDNCPALPNPTQDDADDNGVGDVCEETVAPVLPGIPLSGRSDVTFDDTSFCGVPVILIADEGTATQSAVFTPEVVVEMDLHDAGHEFGWSYSECDPIGWFMTQGPKSDDASDVVEGTIVCRVRHVPTMKVENNYVLMQLRVGRAEARGDEILPSRIQESDEIEYCDGTYCTGFPIPNPKYPGTPITSGVTTLTIENVRFLPGWHYRLELTLYARIARDGLNVPRERLTVTYTVEACYVTFP